jgi:DHA1 family bicyclomycin/chloramphenicol resistance-like MFS transporter
MGCGNVSEVILSPALSSITEYFDVDQAASQALLSGFFIPMALFPLVYGTLSDRFGRRPPLLFGLAVLTLGGLLGAMTESFEILVLARVLQGLGNASVGLVVITIINDLYERSDAASVLASITGIMMIVPVFSFAFGGLITDLISWKGIMILIFLTAIISLVLSLLYLPETNLRPLQKVDLASLNRNYLSLLTNRAYLAYMLVSAFIVGMWLTMLGFVPFEYQRMGVDSAGVGFWFMLAPIGHALGNFFTIRFVHRLGIERMIQIGSLLTLLAVSALILPDLMSWNHPISIGIPCMFFGFTSGLAVNPAITSALAAAGDLAGSASGLMRSAQMGFGVLGGAAVVSLGGYENYENGVGVLIGLALLTTVASTLAMHFSSSAVVT